MVNVYRVVLTAILSLLACQANAGCTYTGQSQQTGATVSSGTALGFCAAASPSNTANFTYTISANTETSCTYQRSDGQLLSGSMFKNCIADPVCTPPQVLSADHNSCVAPVVTADSVCASLNASGVPLSTNSTKAGLSGCQSGFVVRASGASFPVLNGVAGKGELYGPFTCSGATCSGTGTGSSAVDPPPAVQEPNASQCKSTEYWGSVNGVSLCVKGATNIASGSSTAAPTPSGSASAPISAVSPNAPPSATGATKETACTAGTCTTTTTFTGAGGAVVGTVTDQLPQKSFCEENPVSPVCVESRFSGSACGSVDSCSGDAIQCAIQAQAKKTACAFESSAAATAEENAYTAARALTGDQTTGSGINSTVNVSASSFDQTNLLGAEVGLSDLTVTVMGRATTLPLSGLNTWFDVLGKLLMGVTAILCMRIVARG